MNHICAKCNKSYESYSGLFRHNKNYHLNDVNTQKKDPSNKCQYCGKELSSYSCKWRHEKTCKLNTTDIVETVKKLQDEVNDLKTQLKSAKTINSNNNQSNNINSNNNQIICVFPLGKEPDNVLSVEFIEKTLKEHGLNSVIEIVKKKHFNPDLPQCHQTS
jgi:hypothetical protein